MFFGDRSLVISDRINILNQVKIRVTKTQVIAVRSIDRQITLEQQLVSRGIDPCKANSAKIWQVLYKTSAEDRKWFLERVLTSDQLTALEDLQAEPGKLLEIIQDFATNSIKESQKKARENFENKRRKLKEKEDKLKEEEGKFKEKKALMTTKIIANATGGLVRFIGQDLSNKINDEVYQQLAKKNPEDTKTSSKVEEPLEEIQSTKQQIQKIASDVLNKKYFQITWNTAIRWIKRNWVPILVIFVSFSIALIILFKSGNSDKQIAAVITALSPGIITFQNSVKNA